MWEKEERAAKIKIVTLKLGTDEKRNIVNKRD
jgi:hypothetical protein